MSHIVIILTPPLETSITFFKLQDTVSRLFVTALFSTLCFRLPLLYNKKEASFGNEVAKPDNKSQNISLSYPDKLKLYVASLFVYE